MPRHFAALLCAAALLLVPPSARAGEYDALHANTVWLQGRVGGTPYDARREVYVGRFSGGAAAGYRFDWAGVFLDAEYDVTFDFTRDTEQLDLANVGVGAEALYFGGGVRSAVVVGASTLINGTVIDEAGTTGWFLDIRPVALRWPATDQLTLELTPLTFDVATPVVEGLPLVLTGYFSLLGLEWTPWGR